MAMTPDGSAILEHIRPGRTEYQHDFIQTHIPTAWIVYLALGQSLRRLAPG